MENGLGASTGALDALAMGAGASLAEGAGFLLHASATKPRTQTESAAFTFFVVVLLPTPVKQAAVALGFRAKYRD